MIVLFKSDTTDWDTLTMLDTDALVDLVPGFYQGSFTWQTTIDLPNVDVTTQLKTIVSDNWDGGPEQTLSDVYVDNETGPILVDFTQDAIYPRAGSKVTLEFSNPIDVNTVSEQSIYINGISNLNIDPISDTKFEITSPEGYPANSGLELFITPV